MNKPLLKQALDALLASRCYVDVEGSDAELDVHRDVIAALDAELAKPDPEPVAWIMDHASWSLPIVQIAEPTSLGLRSIMRPLYAAPTEPNCRFPTCHSQEFQDKLADEVASELVTGKGCLSNCDTCTYAWSSPANPGHCFMFYEEPQGACPKHSEPGQTRNCSRHPDAPHGPDGAGGKCHSWAPGEAS